MITKVEFTTASGLVGIACIDQDGCCVSYKVKSKVPRRWYYSALNEVGLHVEQFFTTKSHTMKKMYQGKEVEVIDLTPTWTAMLPQMLAVYCHFLQIESPTKDQVESQKKIEEEFRRMAEVADLQVANGELDKPYFEIIHDASFAPEQFSTLEDAKARQVELSSCKYAVGTTLYFVKKYRTAVKDGRVEANTIPSPSTENKWDRVD